MLILSAIGRFFKKIWDWIKQTAWIQPLLIVGIIFGVIFSIPSIVKAVQKGKAEKNKYEAYYHQFQYSLEEGENSLADQLTYKLEAIMNGDENQDLSNFKYKGGKETLGDKFFVAYVGQDCEKCSQAKGGFEVLEEKLNNDPAFKSTDGTGFKMITIFSDEETSETDDKESAFVKYLNRHQSFFEAVGSRAYETDYFINDKLPTSELEYLENADPQNFLTPTILLVELNENSEAFKKTGFDIGVTEVMFGVDGQSDYDKAKTLRDCWNHEGIFSVNKTLD